MTKCKIMLVSVEPLWPATHGGRLRSAKLAETLAEGGEVLVVAPVRPESEVCEPPTSIKWLPLEWTSPRANWGRIHWLPWMGLYAIRNARALQAAIDDFRPDYIYWSHSYMAAVGMRRVATPAKHIVEFANIERDRYRSIAHYGPLKNRISAFTEFLKAMLWEHIVAKNADLCVAINRSDHELLLSRGAQVVLVENAVPHSPVGGSPASATVLSVANWQYGPNRDGILDFLDRQWGKVVAAVPEAQLVLVGKDSEVISAMASESRNVIGLGFVENLADEYRKAALFLAPAKTGAGSQLKVAEALGHSRCVVGPAFLARELRPGLPEGALQSSNDVGEKIIEALKDTTARWRLEIMISDYAKAHGWQHETLQLRKWMGIQ